MPVFVCCLAPASESPSSWLAPGTAQIQVKLHIRELRIPTPRLASTGASMDAPLECKSASEPQPPLPRPRKTTSDPPRLYPPNKKTENKKRRKGEKEKRRQGEKEKRRKEERTRRSCILSRSVVKVARSRCSSHSLLGARLPVAGAHGYLNMATPQEVPRSVSFESYPDQGCPQSKNTHTQKKKKHIATHGRLHGNFPQHILRGRQLLRSQTQAPDMGTECLEGPQERQTSKPQSRGAHGTAACGGMEIGILF